jgi:pimeloyl-ACP methyl ester carboxylesterase
MAGAAGVLAAAAAAQLLPVEEDLHLDDLAHPEMRALQVRQRRVACLDRGAGETTLVFLHGFAGNQLNWRYVAPALADRYRVISLDLWGFGASERPALLTPHDWTEQVLGTLDTLGIQRAVLVGHSIGGRVALSCAAQAPSRVRGVVLIASDGAQQMARYPLLWAMARTPVLHVMLYRLRRSTNEVLALLRGTYGRDFTIGPEIIDAYQRPLRVHGTQASWLHLGRVYPGGDLRAILPRVQCPVSLIWGARDRVTPVRNAFEIANALPTTDLLVVPRAGHLPHEEYPEQVTEHLERFLHGLSGI